jgi:hypothetical protein
MFAVIYRSYIKQELEDECQRLWNQVASYFIQHRGAIGSCLHKTEEGIWLAYSRWPDKATRDASWSSDNNPINDLPDVVKEAIIKMKDCGDENRKLPEICMEVVDDLLLTN